jgi:hypothetical protein
MPIELKLTSVFCDLEWTRTTNLLIRSQVLYPLSYEANFYSGRKGKSGGTKTPNEIWIRFKKNLWSKF